MTEAFKLPDDSGVSFGKFELPKDHWIHGLEQDGSGAPPMFMRLGTASPLRAVFSKAVREAAQYAVRASTACGKDTDFDPDAMVNNMLVGLLGYFTPNGLSGDALDELENPPKLFAPQLTLPRAQVRDIALAHGFTEKPQGEGKPDDLHPYVYLFANAMAMAVIQQFIGELGTVRYLADVPVEIDTSGAELAKADE